MSETKTISMFGVWWCLFVGIKLAGHSLAAWSWWWMFLPIVPLIWLLIERVGL